MHRELFPFLILWHWTNTIRCCFHQNIIVVLKDYFSCGCCFLERAAEFQTRPDLEVDRGASSSQMKFYSFSGPEVLCVTFKDQQTTFPFPGKNNRTIFTCVGQFNSHSRLLLKWPQISITNGWLSFTWNESIICDIIIGLVNLFGTKWTIVLTYIESINNL